MRFLLPTIFTLFLLLSSTHVSCHVTSSILDINDFSSFETAIQQGELDGFFSVGQVDQMMNFMYSHFPDLMLPVKVIGHSVEKRDINLYCFTKKGGDTTLEQEASTKTIGLLTSLHHPREPLSLTMAMFFIFRVLVEYRKGKTESVSLLDNNIFCLIPFVGIDGYTMIENVYKDTKEFKPIRKNRNLGSGNCGEDHLNGVDLNRNYDFNWDQNDKGSSPDECQESYRGTAPFSEPETRAIRDFVEAFRDRINLAVNLHTFGNLWIYPSRHGIDDNPEKMDRVKSIYKDFHDNAPLPPNSKNGTGPDTVGYAPNGDSCEWLLGKHGIVSYNPEMGLGLDSDNQFFPPRSVHYNVVSQNFAGLFYMFNKLNPVIKLERPHITHPKVKTINPKVSAVLFNEAYRDLWEPALKFVVYIPSNDPRFTRGARTIPIRMIERNPNSEIEPITTYGTAKYAMRIPRHNEAIKDKDMLVYIMEQPIDFKSWNKMSVEAVLPRKKYAEVIVEIDIKERGQSIYNYWAEFDRK